MAFVPLPLGFKAEVKFSLAGELMVNVYHFKSTVPVTTVNMTIIAEIIRDAWVAQVQDLQGAAVSLQEIVMTDISVEDGAQVIFVDDLPQAGQALGELLPFNVAVVISNKSGFTGRSRNGRTYIGGFTENFVAGSTPAIEILTNLLAYHITIADSAGAADASFGVASYISDGEPRTEAVFTPYDVFTVDGVTDSQRRRLPGRGI